MSDACSPGLPTVSVVIPLYNHEAYIEAAIDSVRGQGFEDWELIIIDDGSTDSSLRVAQRCLAERPDPRIQLISQPNAGSHATLNRGLALARGRYLAILNSDDLYLPGRLQALVDRALAHGREEFFGVTPVRLIDGRGLPIRPGDPGAWWQILYDGILEKLHGGDLLGALLWGNFTVSTSNFFISRVAYEKLGPLRNFRYVLDWEYALRAALELPGALTWLEGEPLLAYRMHGRNTILGGSLRNHVEAAYMLRRAQRRILSAGGTLPPHAVVRLKQLDRFLRQESIRRQAVPIRVLEDIRNSRSWRLTAPLRAAGERARAGRAAARRLAAALRTLAAGVARRVRSVLPGSARADYARWLRHEQAQTEALRAELPQRLACLPALPRVSVVVPVFDADASMLATMIGSVLGQMYPHLELCLCDDASSRLDTRAVLQRYAALDARIRVVRRDSNGHIVHATNDALAVAEGEWVAFLDHDDLLAPQALLRMVETALAQPDADVIYSDEDKIDAAGRRSLPLFKPGWSPGLAWCQNYVGHLMCVRRSVLQALGGLREGLEGSQDHDLVLRLAASGARFHHLPEVLYHWRQHRGSTAANAQAKPYAHGAGARAVAEHLRARYGDRFRAVEETGLRFVYGPRFALAGRPCASIIIPTRDRIDLLAPCIASIFERSTWPELEVIVLDNGSVQEETARYLAGLQHANDRVRVIPAAMEFNWSRLNNIGARQARGQFLVFLNNDTLVMTPDWLERLMEVAGLPDVGTVGPQLLFEDGTLQHAGVVVGMGGWADHVYRGARPVHFPSPFVSSMVPRNVLANTGACLVMARERFEALGGFDEAFRICGSDVEIGLRAHRAGLQNLYWPFVQLRHLESKTRSPHVPEGDFVQSERKYAPFRTGGDPFYNPNLDPMQLLPRPLFPARTPPGAAHG